MTKRQQARFNGTMRAIGYRRVSTADQVESGAGLDAQGEALRLEAERRGWELTIVTDAGLSAKSMERPALASAIARLDAGEADVLVVSKLDRLSRSTKDFVTLLDHAGERGWKINCLDLGVDTTSPTGELLSSIVAATATYERRLIGVRTREGMAAKRAAGVHTGRRSTLPESTRARVVDERAAGRSFPSIAAGLNVDGVSTATGRGKWFPATVAAVVGSVTTRAMADA